VYFGFLRVVSGENKKNYSKKGEAAKNCGNDGAVGITKTVKTTKNAQTQKYPFGIPGFSFKTGKQLKPGMPNG